MNKKGQGISINVIVIAAISLIVLVVLAAVFISNIAPVPSTTKNCEALSGKCLSACDIVPYTKEYKVAECPNELKCCTVGG